MHNPRKPLSGGFTTRCGGQTVYGGAGGIAGYNSLALSTRDGNRRFTVALNTASNDPLAATDKLLRIARSVFCG